MLLDHVLSGPGKKSVDLRKVRFYWDGAVADHLYSKVAFLDENFHVLCNFVCQRQNPVLPLLAETAEVYGITVLRERDFVKVKE